MQYVRIMSSRRHLTKLTSRPSNDRFLSMVDRLESEANPVDQATGQVRVVGRQHKAHKIGKGATVPSAGSDRSRKHEVAFESLVDTLRGQLDLPRPAAVIQALRNAELRTAFVAEVGVLSAAEVSRLAGSQAKNSSALAGRWRADRKVFAVPWGGDWLYPAFQFAEGEPRPVISRILEVFGAETSGWEIALWFATPSPYLNHDARPIEQLDNPDALVSAATADRRLPEF